MEPRDLNYQGCEEKEESVKETEKDKTKRYRDKEGKGGKRPFHGCQRNYFEKK